MKVKACNYEDGSLHGYGFKCPGCGAHHVINTVKPNGSGAIWIFNGDVNNPTFTPSINSMTGHYIEGQPQPPNCYYCNVGLPCTRCHFFITNGNIYFCPDSTHEKAGMNLPLPIIE